MKVVSTLQVSGLRTKERGNFYINFSFQGPKVTMDRKPLWEYIKARM